MKRFSVAILGFAVFVPIALVAVSVGQPDPLRPTSAVTQKAASSAKTTTPAKKSAIPPKPAAVPKGRKISRPLAQVSGAANKKLIEQYPKGIEPLNLDDFKKLVLVSSKTIGVSLKSAETVTVGQVNKLLADNQAKLIGMSLFPGELYLLIPDAPSISALAAFLARVKQSSIVDLAFPIVQYETSVFPQYQPDKWHWAWILPETENVIYTPPRSDAGTANAANAHLKIIRAPQSWVFADFCNATWNAGKCPSYAKDFWTAFVLDDGIAAHDELPLYPKGRLLVTSNGEERDHGTPVVGVMAAAHDGAGVEGVNPKGGIIFQSFYDTNKSQTQIMLAPIKHFYWVPTLRVANMSLGSALGRELVELKERDPGTYKVALAGIVPMMRDLTLQALRNAQFLLQARKGSKNARPFYIVTAAQNVPEISDLDANITSGYCGASEFFTRNNNRSFLDASQRVICVGDYNPFLGKMTSADYPNAISAPGDDILAPQPGRASPEKDIPDNYEFVSGASFATPQVAAAIDYLLTVADSSIAGTMKDILWDSAHVLNGKRVLDVFGAFMLVDQKNSEANPKWDRELQRYLVDVNVAGDLDGNPRPGKSVKTRGDGQVDVRDFRAFRDALYQVVTGDLDFPDKSSRSDPSKDLNGDGCVKGGSEKCDIEENVYPRYDFNGDGVLSAVTEAKFKGKERSDLDVFADLWPKDGDARRDGASLTADDLTESTNGYSEGELKKLVSGPDTFLSGSGDIHVSVRFTADFDELRLTFAPAEWRPITRRIMSGAKPQALIHTVPANVDVELSAVAYKNGKPAERRVEEKCVMKDGKTGVRRRTEKIDLYVGGKNIAATKLSTKLPSVSPVADESYTITSKVDSGTWSDCSAPAGSRISPPATSQRVGDEIGNCPQLQYRNTCERRPAGDIGPDGVLYDPAAVPTEPRCSTSRCYVNVVPSRDRDGNLDGGPPSCDIVQGCHDERRPDRTREDINIPI